MNTSTRPSVSSQISGPVVALWIAGLAGLTNCPGIKLPSISFASSDALAMAPFMPFAPSVSTSSAPYALRMLRLSTLMVSGMVSMILYPLDAAMAARPMPVLPEVGSMMTDPSLRSPFSSASSIIALAILSLTEPAGLKYSSFTRTLASRPSSFSMFVTSTRGVLPMSSIAPLYIFAIFLPSFYLMALKPFSRSAIMSSMCSVPMESLIVLGLMP